MHKFLRNTVILLTPIIFMIIVNELVRPTVHGAYFSKHDVSTINTDLANTNECTWECHNNTAHCKKHHVKYLKPYFRLTDPLYFGLISALMQTGNYGAANLVFLVLLTPLTIWFFIIKSIGVHEKLNELKQGK